MEHNYDNQIIVMDAISMVQPRYKSLLINWQERDPVWENLPGTRLPTHRLAHSIKCLSQQQVVYTLS